MKILASNIKLQTFDCFNVFSIENNSAFKYINFNDNDSFYNALFDYFFDEKKLIEYCANKKKLKFNPTSQNFAMFYKFLKKFIDSENIEKDIDDIDEELFKIINEEYTLVIPESNSNQQKLRVKLDKIGKIGEYIFSCILSNYYNYDCILPKLHLITNYNMSVFGIDTLFYREIDDLLLFGESKISYTLDNGINLINKSLKDYEKLISDEFEIVLCNPLYKDKLNKFNEIFSDRADSCISIVEFIEKAKIQKIGIPIFIAHGRTTCEREILQGLSSIKIPNILGITPVLIAISLPIINKDKFIFTFTEMIRKKMEYYDNQRN